MPRFISCEPHLFSNLWRISQNTTWMQPSPQLHSMLALMGSCGFGSSHNLEAQASGGVTTLPPLSYFLLALEGSKEYQPTVKIFCNRLIIFLKTADHESWTYVSLAIEDSCLLFCVSWPLDSEICLRQAFRSSRQLWVAKFWQFRYVSVRLSLPFRFKSSRLNSWYLSSKPGNWESRISIRTSINERFSTIIIILDFQRMYGHGSKHGGFKPDFPHIGHELGPFISIFSLLVLSPSYPHRNDIFADVQRLEALGNRGHVRACAAARKKTTDRGENPLGGPKKGTHQTSRSNSYSLRLIKTWRSLILVSLRHNVSPLFRTLLWNLLARGKIKVPVVSLFTAGVLLSQLIAAQSAQLRFGMV